MVLFIKVLSFEDLNGRNGALLNLGSTCQNLKPYLKIDCKI